MLLQIKAMGLKVLRLVLLFNILIQLGVSRLQAETVHSDKVYLRVENHYYSGTEVSTWLEKIKTFSCLKNNQTIILKILNHKKLNLAKVLNMKVQDSFFKDLDVKESLITFFKIHKFVSSQKSNLSLKKMNTFSDALEQSRCSFKSNVLKDRFKYLKDLIEIDLFFIERFKVGKELSSLNSALIFVESLKKQYKHEFFELKK